MTLSADAELALPEQVTIALADLASAAREVLLAVAVRTGLQMLQVMLVAALDRRWDG